MRHAAKLHRALQSQLPNWLLCPFTNVSNQEHSDRWVNGIRCPCVYCARQLQPPNWLSCSFAPREMIICRALCRPSTAGSAFAIEVAGTSTRIAIRLLGLTIVLRASRRGRTHQCKGCEGDEGGQRRGDPHPQRQPHAPPRVRRSRASEPPAAQLGCRGTSASSDAARDDNKTSACTPVISMPGSIRRRTALVRCMAGQSDGAPRGVQPGIFGRI